MARYNGLIIPRSYNDYFSRSDPQAIRDIVALAADGELNAESKNPLQNQAIAKIVPVTASPENKLIVQSQISGLTADVETIKNIIPNTASETNELADKNFVNSTVGTNTANYIYKTESGGEKVPFSSVAELEAYAGTVTNNDYAFVTGIDENGNAYYDRYKADVNDGVVTWAKEYRLNNSSFTAEQWAAIQSGITAEKVAQFEGAVAPVDVVQSGNMSAVTSNAVADSLDEVMPAGTILPGMWQTAPKGFLLCDGATYQTSQYPVLANVLGATGSTFTVPNLAGRFLQGANRNLGSFIEAGLPNIKGEAGILFQEDSVSGAFIVGSFADNYAGTSNQGSRYFYYFDASKGETKLDGTIKNDVYGKSSTVQPPAFTVNYIIKY